MVSNAGVSAAAVLASDSGGLNLQGEEGLPLAILLLLPALPGLIAVGILLVADDLSAAHKVIALLAAQGIIMAILQHSENTIALLAGATVEIVIAGLQLWLLRSWWERERDRP